MTRVQLQASWDMLGQHFEHVAHFLEHVLGIPEVLRQPLLHAASSWDVFYNAYYGICAAIDRCSWTSLQEEALKVEIDVDNDMDIGDYVYGNRSVVGSLFENQNFSNDRLKHVIEHLQARAMYCYFKAEGQSSL